MADNPADDFPQPCPADSWKKHGVVLAPDRDDEFGFLQNFSSSAEPLDNGRWRLWYSISPHKPINIAFAEGVPGEKMTKHHAILSEKDPEDSPLAVGNLPKGWNPTQCVHIQLKNGTHRLYFWAHGPNVMRFLAADSNDGRRYRVVNPLRPIICSGPGDKFKKDLPANQKVDDISVNDATTVYQLPDGSFELYTQGLAKVDKKDVRFVAHDNLAGYIRFIDRFTSEDGLLFTNRQRQLIVADKEDPIDTQFYYMNVTHTPRGRVGMIGAYRVQAGITEPQYCFSKDGTKWNRIRQPWIACGKPGEPDSMAIYPARSIVHHDNKWWLFYTAVNSTHSTFKPSQPDEKPTTCLMLATTPTLWKE